MNKEMLLTIFFIIVLGISLPQGQLAKSRSVLSWKSGATIVTLSQGGRLTVNGIGAMDDYAVNDEFGVQLPWRNSKNAVVSVVIKNGVTTIGKGVFAECKNLTSVTIPSSVTVIKSSAFEGCVGVTSITIPDGVKTIATDAFIDCAGLASINVDVDNTYYCSENGVLFNKNKTVLIKYPPDKKGAYIIPNSVTNINGNAFTLCPDLISVTIPNGVTDIVNRGFLYCVSLTSIEVAADNAHYSSKDGVLFNNNRTTIISYPQGRKGTYTIPDGVTDIGDLAFYECVGLTSVTIPNSVASIGKGAFRRCTNLTTVNIGNSVTSIGEMAFYACYNLTSITIPGSVAFIASDTFWYCALKSITVQNPIPPLVANDAFYNTDNTCLYVPVMSIDVYKAANGGWKGFKCIEGTGFRYFKRNEQ